MRIGVRRLPRRRDPRRRFRNRLLVGMVGVALLPLVAFAVLAVFELDTVAKSTANATETAILQRQRSQQQSSLSRSAASVDHVLAVVNSQLTSVAQAMIKQLGVAAATALLPKGLTNAGDVSYLDDGAINTLVLATGAAAEPDGKFAAATSSTPILEVVGSTLKADPSIASIWIENQSTGALRAWPAFSVSSALSGQRYDITHPTLRNGLDVFASSEGGVATIPPAAWIAPGEPGRNENGPFWTDPYDLLEFRRVRGDRMVLAARRTDPCGLRSHRDDHCAADLDCAGPRRVGGLVLAGRERVREAGVRDAAGVHGLPEQRTRIHTHGPGQEPPRRGAPQHGGVRHGSGCAGHGDAQQGQ